MKDSPGVKHPTEETAIDRGLASVRHLILSDKPAESLLLTACESVVSAVPGADMAGVTMLRADVPNFTSDATDVRIHAIDRAQFDAGQGPSLEAAARRRLVRARWSDVATRWPSFAAFAGDAGVRSFLSAPLEVDDTRRGALNVYSYRDDAFTDTDDVVVKLIVTAVETALAQARRLEQTEAELDGLREAMRTRGTIEQAKGIVMAIRGLSPEDAFEVLSLQSQNENVKLATIAQRIVDSVSTNTPGQGGVGHSRGGT